jgi:hypothetical protein
MAGILCTGFPYILADTDSTRQPPISLSPSACTRFGTSLESWLNQQSQYDLWHAEQHRSELRVKRLVAA